MRDADVLLVIGGRLSEIAIVVLHADRHTPAEADADPRLSDPEEIAASISRRSVIVATPHAFASALSTVHPPVEISWSVETRAAREAFLAWTDKPTVLPGDFQYGEAMVWLREHLPAETIIANGAGNYAIWVHRYWRYRDFLASWRRPPLGRLLCAGRRDGQAAVPQPSGGGVCRDGCFLMNGQEFATAVQYDIPLWCGRRQRHVRHHPHASGARVSRPRVSPPGSRNPTSPRWRAPMAAMARR